MKISKQALRESRQLFRSCLVNGVVDESRARNVIRLLAEQKPRGYIPILERFRKFLEMDAAQRAARVESATPLTPEFQAKLQADLKRIYGEGLTFTFVHKPELLGGLRIQVGGDVYNGSVQSRLAALRESF